jgi:DNA-binding transcriptional regulator YiaG
MTGMFDVTCEKCGKRFGWGGKLTDRPPCPVAHCGYRPPAAELASIEAKMEESFRLDELHPKDATPDELGAKRKLTGLTIRQAAKLLGLADHLAIVEWEAGRSRPTAEQAEKLHTLYSGG